MWHDGNGILSFYMNGPYILKIGLINLKKDRQNKGPSLKYRDGPQSISYLVCQFEEFIHIGNAEVDSFFPEVFFGYVFTKMFHGKVFYAHDGCVTE
jgi:hypothetical protein